MGGKAILSSSANPLPLIDYERCPRADVGDCDAGSWMVRSDGYKIWLVCRELDCPFYDRPRAHE